MKNSFFYSYLRTSKKFIWLILATITILSVIFIRTVPNYSKKYGFEIVHLWDYNKYKQGYCLTEGRILDKEELYERAVKSYFVNIKKEAQYPKYYNYWDDKYVYVDSCSDGDCNFYYFAVTNLNQLNDLIMLTGKIDVNDFIKKYGSKFELGHTQILKKDGNLTSTIGFDNLKSTYLEIYLPDAFSIVAQDKMSNDKKLMEKNSKRKFPPSDCEYSRYYLKVKIFFKSSGGNKVKPFDIKNDIIISQYIPITNCGQIKFNDILSEPGAFKYVFIKSEN